MGNVLFAIFVNDITNLNIDGKIILYADDTSIVVKAENYDLLMSKITSVVCSCEEWFKANGLKLNSEKTTIVLFSPRPPKTSLGILLSGNQVVQTVLDVKLLGFKLDSSLTWSSHVDLTCSKMAKGVFALRQLKPLVSKDGLKECYYAYVHSIMSYGIILWGCSSDNERVLKMQKRALRVLVGAAYRDSCRDYFRQQGILTSISVYIFEVLVYVRSHLNEFKIRANFNPRVTKDSLNIVAAAPTALRLSKRAPKSMGRILYNKLPHAIKALKSDAVFRGRVRAMLQEKTIYSIKEYLSEDFSKFDK